MEDHNIQNYIQEVLKNMPTDWLKLTTHKLDIYNEELAKTEFLQQFEQLYENNTTDPKSLSSLPTAYDYIRLGHPLSCVLEWAIAKKHGLKAEQVISFSSRTVPILSVLRKNLIANRNTTIAYQGDLPESFDAETVKKVYGYHFDLLPVNAVEDIFSSKNLNEQSSIIFISSKEDIAQLEQNANVDFYINTHPELGSVLLVNGEENKAYISEIQHVRRRETIAMTPANCHIALQSMTDKTFTIPVKDSVENHKSQVLKSIHEITGSGTKALVASSGLSMQYAIMMGLVHDALENHPGKAIKFIVPPNCYGGTNDQARRVAACLPHVEVVDLPVDGDNEMVQSIENILTKIAEEDAVPYIIAEIPTNPRVEVPDLQRLREVLSKVRTTPAGTTAIAPVFVLDQTFCPNVLFLGEGEILSELNAISYVSGSKFPSGGLSTAGYCVGNKNTEGMMDKVEKHLILCDNEATALQYEILAKQMPSMNQRIYDAYVNTRDFVNFIQETLPAAKINFVSEELAKDSFTPSVFSLDLPTKGETEEEKETYKRALNLKLINLMISEIPAESKFCVSYGQLKGCYWTIPATSTQGTTKEGDKDYIVRASLSPAMDLDLHKKVFQDFVNNL